MVLTAARHLAAVFCTAVVSFVYFSSNKIPTLSTNKSPTSPDTYSALPEIQRLQAYLQINTAHPKPDYQAAVAFLNNTIHTLLPNTSVSIYELAPSKLTLLATIAGLDPSLPTVLLNSHTDVVPAESDKWGNLTPPFDARLQSGRVFARGAQDMKSVGLQYIEALAKLIDSGWRNRRSIHVSFVADEEIGGHDGMGRLVSNEHTVSGLSFESLNVGVALDEGEPSPTDRFQVFYGERQVWWFEVAVTGSPGHGATFPNSTATQSLQKIIGKALTFREEELVRLNTEKGTRLGDVTSVNIVYLDAGVRSESQPGGFALNVIPSSARAGFDVRVPPQMTPDMMTKEIQSWLEGCCDADSGTHANIRVFHKAEEPVTTSRNSEENPFIVPFNYGLEQAGIIDELDHGIFFAATDSRFLRLAGIPCFGFSPIRNTPNMMHKHDEFIMVDGYLEGIEIYRSLIRSLADFDGDPAQLQVHHEEL